MMKKSYFIEEQIPFFIRDQYPLFISLIKGYYDYLDRSQNEFIAVKVKNSGKNYKNPSLKIYVLDLINASSTYGQYILDSRPLELIPIVKNGRIEKVMMKNYKNVKYSEEEHPVIVVTDSSGSGAELEPVILYNMGNIYETAQLVPFIRDIDTTNEIFKEFLYNELIPTIPVTLYENKESVEKDKFIKFIKQIYNSKGIEGVFSFVYRILYNSTVQFYYPKTDILRVSDGIWIKNYWLIFSTNIENYVGYKIVSNSVTGIIAKVEAHPTLPGKWKALIRERSDNFTAGEDVYVFDFKFETGELIGTIHSIEEEAGYNKNDNGQLSSLKKIQDNYYYQEFSYELQSEYNIKEFSLVLEELLHPAGFKYFIKILLELTASENVLDLGVALNYNDVKYGDIEIIAGEDAFLYKRPLGMTLQDIFVKYFEEPVNFYTLNKTITGLTNGVPTDTGVLYGIQSDNTTALLQNNTMYGYSIVITDGVATYFYRTIIESLPATNSVKVNSNFTPNGNSMNAYIYPGYYPAAVAGANITLSFYDPFNIASENNTADPNKRMYIGYTMYILRGAAQGEKRKIIAYNGTTRTVTLESAFTNAVTTESVYKIVRDLDGTEYFGAKIESVNVIKGGSGYSASPSLVVSSPPSGTSPTFNITVSGGVITSITIALQGTGYYYSIPDASITDATGSGCVFELVLGFEQNDSNIKHFLKSLLYGKKLEIDTKDWFESAKIRVIVSPPFINSVILENPGKGYWFTPRTYQKTGDGSSGKIITTVSGGAVSTVSIQQFGNDYNYDPEFLVEAATPSISSILQNGEYFGKLLYANENYYYFLNLIKFFDSSQLNANLYGINITREASSTVIFTKYLQTKYNYNSEIEVI